MALAFTGGTTDRVNCGSASGIDNASSVTCAAWIYPTSFVNGTIIAGKCKPSTNNGWRLIIGATTGQLRFYWDRATTDMDFISNSTPLVANSWNFAAGIADSSGAKLYGGNLTSDATEVTYGTSTVGSGALQGDAAQVFGIGNNDNATPNGAFNGSIAIVGFWYNEIRTLAQIRAWQFNPRVDSVNMKILMLLGYNGTGTQPDWSGNGNSGAVTGATVGAHVPLGPFFGYDIGWQGNMIPPSTSFLSRLALLGAG